MYANRVDSLQRNPWILQALHYNSRGWLSAPDRTAAHPLHCCCVIKVGWASLRQSSVRLAAETSPPEVTPVSLQNKNIYTIEN